ncbi:hypothetical protein Tco_0480598 [Tanacetum coccineum]
MLGCSWRGHLRGAHIHYCPVFLEGTPMRGTYSLLPGVLGGDTLFLEGTPVMGTYGFHYCPGVLGGDTYEGSVIGVKKTCNNDKSLSEIQLEHEKEDEFVVVVVKVTRRGSGGESFWEEGDDFGVDVLRFHTCLTDILGFLEKLKWWLEKDIDDEEEEDEEGEGGSEV